MLNILIRTQKSEGNTSLFTKIRVGKQAVWVNMRLNVDISKWNEVSNSSIKTKNYLEKLGHYRKIQDMEYAFQELKRHNRLSKENIEIAVQDIVLADIRERVKKETELAKNIEEQKNNNIKTFIIKYIDGINKGVIRSNSGEKYTPNSIKTWNQFKRVFINFYDIRPFDWQDINQMVVDRFISYLEDDCGYMKSTNERYISLFKTIVRVAERKCIHTNYIAKSVFHIPTVREQDKAKEIYLTKEELQALYKMELNGLEEMVRDVFLIGCYTAQRFSDYSRIDEHCIGTTPKGTRVIKLSQVKTKTSVVIPILDPKLETLLKKYNYNVPSLNDVVFNRYIKKICHKLSETTASLAVKERTKLNKKELLREQNAQKEGKKLFEYDEQGFPIKPRWELVSSHTARRTAITNMFLSGNYTIGQMMYVSGHKKEKTFNNYVKLSLDEFADNVASASSDGLF
ncbi:MAG: phage integrase SAM-like domain-containing protein [Bacteroidales bacterium]|nr:phage integrase SAM-like domain-containing protein [Bacteroidales bacterium]